MTTSVATDGTAWTASRPRRIVYRTLLALSALAAGLFGGRLLVVGWFSTLDGGSHRFHELTWGVLEGAVILVGLLAALWCPSRRPVAYQQVAVGIAALLVTMVMIRETDPATILIAALIAVAGLLHPARDQLRRVGPWDGPGLLVAAVTAAPLVWYAIGEAALHRAGVAGDPHVALAHYAGSTAAALALAGLAVLAASRGPGHRLAAASSAGGLAVLGVASLLWPEMTSSFGTLGGSASLTGAVAIAATGLRREPDPIERRPQRSVMTAGLIMVVGLLGAACADGAEPAASSATEDVNENAGTTVEVAGIDYAFDDVPAEVEAGSSLTFTNESDVEVHEMIVMRVADDETRTLEELLELPDAEAEQVTEYVGMRVALPGEDGIDPENPTATGGIALHAPGRYVLLCFIPEGADPQAYRDAIEGESDGPPEVDGGPPHAAIGMASEVTVTP